MLLDAHEQLLVTELQLQRDLQEGMKFKYRFIHEMLSYTPFLT